jgi:hypothetical protein
MDILIKNATVHTLEDENDHAEAIGITGTRISHIGRTDELTQHASENTRVIDGEGLTAIPGFIDSHTHFLDMGVKKFLYLNLGEASSKDELLDLVESYARDNPNRTWVLGNNWDESNWTGDQTFPTKGELDKVVSDRPLALQRVDCHTYCVNSKALELLNLDPSTRGAETSSGELTGCLSEDAALVVGKEIAPTGDQMIKGLKEAQKEAHSLGVTGIHQMVIDDGEFRDYFRAYQSLLRNDELDVRCRLYFTRHFLDKLIEFGIESGFGNDRLKIGGLKVFTDGAIGSKTAWISGGYSDDPDNTGISMIETDDLKELTVRAHRNNIQAAIHAIGDRALDQAISAIDYAKRSGNSAAYVPPHRIEHCEMATDEQVDRMAELGIVASMQPNFTGKWGRPGGMYENRFGESSLPELNRCHHMEEKGVRLSFGSDGMPFGPLFGLHWAVNAPFESQKLSPRKGLRAYTRGAALAGGLEEKVGSLEEGKYADIVLLDGDPMKNPESIKDLSVETTIVGGDIVFSNKGAE